MSNVNKVNQNIMWFLASSAAKHEMPLDAASKPSKPLFEYYDSNKDNVLQKKELEKIKQDLQSLISEGLEKYGLKEVRIVGNLPYYITTPIIMKLLEEHTGAESITVMMQKEVADRIAAEPGTKPAGAITYSVHYYADVTRITDVGRESFYPAPKVDSAVLRLDLREEPRVKVSDMDLYFNCIKAGFSHRRKTNDLE